MDAVYCFDLKGNLVGVFSNISDASEKLGVGKAIITQNLQRISKRAHNYVFSHQNKFPGYNNRKRNSRPVECYNREGKLLATYESVLVAAEKTGVDYKKIYTTCNDPASFLRKKNQLKEDPDAVQDQFLFKYSNEQPPAPITRQYPKRQPKYVYMMDEQGEIVRIYESGAAAGREMNLKRQAINACCSNYARTAGGYGWTFDPIAYKNFKDEQRTQEKENLRAEEKTRNYG